LLSALRSPIFGRNGLFRSIMHHHKVIKTTLCVLEQTFEQIAFFVKADD
jgi:hypothetical protein